MGASEPLPVAECDRAWQALRLAHDRIAQRLDTELVRECGLGGSEFDALLYLRTHAAKTVRIGGLQAAVSLSQPALSRLVARLEARGLLVRCGAERDHRAVILTLTEPGSTLIDRAFAIRARVVHEAIADKLSEEDQAALLRALARLGAEGSRRAT
jgi:DNA-binding MarR family transcriptional regulator